jgi:hypothetical protein
MVLSAWRMDADQETDQRALHQQSPNVPVSLEQLSRIGVLYWSMDVASAPPESNAALNAIRAERGYTYTDTITISPEKLENYEGKLKIFFKEHLHTDEEIRLILVRRRSLLPLFLFWPTAAFLAFCAPAARTLTPAATLLSPARRRRARATLTCATWTTRGSASPWRRAT